MAKVTKSQDGLPRMTLKLEARVSLYDLATFLMIRFMYEIPQLGIDDTIEKHKKDSEKWLRKRLKAMTNKQILDTVREVVLSDGQETPSYTVGDSGLSEACDVLTGLLSKRFKGFSTKENL
jgi:hypothetical protein